MYSTYHMKCVCLGAQITRLVDVQTALGDTTQPAHFDALQKLASAVCPLTEYSTLELEKEFGEPIMDLFAGSELESTANVRKRFVVDV